jgi:hypothetical protein
MHIQYIGLNAWCMSFLIQDIRYHAQYFAPRKKSVNLYKIIYVFNNHRTSVRLLISLISFLHNVAPYKQIVKTRDTIPIKLLLLLPRAWVQIQVICVHSSFESTGTKTMIIILRCA